MLHDGGYQPNQHRSTPETRLIVKELYAAGIQKARIAKRLGVSDDTLVKHYEKELDDSLENLINGLAKSLYQRAIDGDEKAAEFWLKCRAKWAAAKSDEDAFKDNRQLTLMEKLIDKL